MKFKGHNAISPCQFCEMKAIPCRSGNRVTYYLTRRKPQSLENPDYGNLPLRVHDRVKQQAEEIERARKGKAKETIQVSCGIRGKVRYPSPLEIQCS